MSRKDALRAMLGNRPDTLPDGNSETPSPPPPPAHTRTGPVGAMSRSLGSIAHAAEQTRALLAQGATVIDIPVDHLEASFVEDRFRSDDVEFEALVQSLSERGQQVPILVRPLAGKAGYYQIAYGHRRVRALQRLGKPARAVVQTLSDEDLVVAQGQENAARTDLSYIERARFARKLEELGFARAVIMSALAVDKTQLSRLLTIAHAVPDAIATLIGAAPKAGRPRWTALAERLDPKRVAEIVARFQADAGFLKADSDGRFARVYASLTTRSVGEEQLCRADGGQAIAAITRSAKRTSFTIDDRATPDFSAFVLRALPDLYDRFKAERGGAETSPRQDETAS